MKIIGLTGGIASGKSTVSSYLQAKGATIIDADKIAHELIAPNGALWLAYIGHFGRKFLREDNTLDTRAIGAVVFESPAEKKWIDGVAHPLIKSAVKCAIEAARSRGERVVILDVPLLFESDWDKMCSRTCLVYVGKKLQLERLMERNGYPEAEAMARIAAQMPMCAKRALADYIVDNSGELATTYSQVDTLWEEWISD